MADEPTTEELIAAAEATRTPIGMELARTQQSMAESGARVTVNLHGKLVDLELDQQAMALPPDDLAALVRRLAAAAAIAALADAIATLSGIGDNLLATALAGQVGRAAPAEDSYTPETWRLS
ncbi:MAG: hypothetical protein ABW224_12515 [Kibdelosporangium sp.]